MGEYIITIEFKADKETARELSNRVGHALDDIFVECSNAPPGIDIKIREAIVDSDQRLVKRIK